MKDASKQLIMHSYENYEAYPHPFGEMRYIKHTEDGDVGYKQGSADNRKEPSYTQKR